MAKGFDITNRVPGSYHVHKFGRADGINPNDGFVDMWNGVEDVNADKNYTYSTTADINTISSSNEDDSQLIDVFGLDSSWEFSKQLITLDGRNKVYLDTPLIRVFRMINRGSSDLLGNVYCYVDGTVLLGIPTVSSAIKAIIKSSDNQTKMSLFTIPDHQKGALESWHASISDKTDNSADIELRLRPYGECFQIKKEGTIKHKGSSHVQYQYTTPETSIKAKTDIALRVRSYKVGGSVSGGFDLMIVKDKT